jgi:hypothetical protein
MQRRHRLRQPSNLQTAHLPEISLESAVMRQGIP